jgi:hypothetical protein
MFSLIKLLDLRPCGLWKPLFAMFESNEPQLRSFTAWVIGTALQNNPQAINDFMELDGIPILKRQLLQEQDEACLTKLLLIVSAMVNDELKWTIELHQQGILVQVAQVLTRPLSFGSSGLVRRVFRILTEILRKDATFGIMFSDPTWFTSMIHLHLLGPGFTKKVTSTEGGEDSPLDEVDYDTIQAGLEFVLQCQRLPTEKRPQYESSLLLQVLSLAESLPVEYRLEDSQLACLRGEV